MLHLLFLSLNTTGKIKMIAIMNDVSRLFSERELTFTFAICHRPSAVVCRLSETIVHPTQAIESFGNVSTPFDTLVIC